MTRRLLISERVASKSETWTIVVVSTFGCAAVGVDAAENGQGSS
jgi:hypothetical protein